MKKCLVCAKEFKTYPSVIKKGCGKYCSQKCFHKSSEGKPAWNSGIKMKPDNRICEVCNKSFQLKPYAIKRGRGKYCSKKCYNNVRSKWMTGKGNHQYGKSWGKGIGNPNWRGGISKLPYSFNFTEELKELIRKRDNYKCQLCGAPQEEFTRKMTVHHIDYDKENTNPKNLLTLCCRCNSKVNFNREYWNMYFSQGGDAICPTIKSVL